jgi:hypothetical protein
MGVINDLFNWDKVSWPKRIVIAIPFIAAFIGWQYWTKSRELKQNHADMVAMCGDDKECTEGVNKFADTCFEEHYRMGRRSQGVKTEEFVSCVNQHAGKTLFVAEPAK